MVKGVGLFPLENIVYYLYNILYISVGSAAMEKKARQSNFLLPEDLLEELRRDVPRREQSKVVAEALRRELRRLRLRKALETSFGAWEEKDHPELASGAETFVRRLRKSSRLKSAK